MKSRTRRMAVFTTKLSVAFATALVLALLVAMLPRVTAGLTAANQEPGTVTAKTGKNDDIGKPAACAGQGRVAAQ